MMSVFAALMAIGFARFLPAGDELGEDVRTRSRALAFALPGDSDEHLLEDGPFISPEPSWLSVIGALTRPERPPPFSLVVETGTYLKDLHFNAVAEDGSPRSITGIGLIPVEIEGSYQVASDWTIGLGALGGFSQDVVVWGVGPQITWRFWAGHAPAPSKPPETEHFLKAGVFWESFQVTESGFGSFKSTAAPQIGYQFRTPMGGGGWTFQLEIRYEYAAFKFSEPVLSGDHSINGNGLLIGIGVGILF
jgi:hypothetical protein